MEASLDVGAGSVPGEIDPHSDAARGDETRTESPAQDASAAGTLSMVVDGPTPTPTPPTPTPGAKKMRNSKPKRVELDLQPGEDVSVTRTPDGRSTGRSMGSGRSRAGAMRIWRATSVAVISEQ